MRELLCHETKLVEQLLRRNPGVAMRMPKVVHCTFVSEVASPGRVNVNLGFTAYFEPGRERRDLELVANCLTAPGVICGELCLVRNRASNELTFLEYLGHCPQDGNYLRPYVEPVCCFIESFRGAGLSKQCMRLCTDVRSASGDSWRCTKEKMVLKHVRLFVFDSCAYFFFSETGEMLERVPARVVQCESRNGSVQFLASESDEVAVEGWTQVEECRDW